MWGATLPELMPKNEKTNHTKNKEEGSVIADQMHVMHGTDYINKEEGEEKNNSSEYSFYHNTHHQPKAMRKDLDMRNVLLLDTAMTINQECNSMLLNKIHTVSSGIEVHFKREQQLTQKRLYGVG